MVVVIANIPEIASNKNNTPVTINGTPLINTIIINGITVELNTATISDTINIFWSLIYTSTIISTP
jgi:hypothetical protein